MKMLSTRFYEQNAFAATKTATTSTTTATATRIRTRTGTRTSAQGHMGLTVVVMEASEIVHFNTLNARYVGNHSTRNNNNSNSNNNINDNKYIDNKYKSKHNNDIKWKCNNNNNNNNSHPNHVKVKTKRRVPECECNGAVDYVMHNENCKRNKSNNNNNNNHRRSNNSNDNNLVAHQRGERECAREREHDERSVAHRNGTFGTLLMTLAGMWQALAHAMSTARQRYYHEHQQQQQHHNHHSQQQPQNATSTLTALLTMATVSAALITPTLADRVAYSYFNGGGGGGVGGFVGAGIGIAFGGTPTATTQSTVDSNRSLSGIAHIVSSAGANRDINFSNDSVLIARTYGAASVSGAGVDDDDGINAGVYDGVYVNTDVAVITERDGGSDGDIATAIDDTTTANGDGGGGGGVAMNAGDIVLDMDVDEDTNATEYIFDRTDVRIVFITLYTIVFCCCFFGNLLVILVVTLSRRLRSITNFFLANLALADFCVGLFCVMQNLSIYLIDSWVFGEFLCRMYQFVHSLSYTASIFILVVICMERYFAIVHPITCKQILTAARLRMVILTVWITSAVYSTPKFVFSKTIKNIHTEDGQEEEICVLDRKMFNSKLLDMINFVLLYVIPLLVMTVLYSKIAIALWRSSRGLSHHIQQQQQHQQHQHQQQQENSMGMHNSMYHHHNHHMHHHHHMHHQHYQYSNHQQQQQQQQPPGTPISIASSGTGHSGIGGAGGGGGLLSRKHSSKYEKQRGNICITDSQVSLDADRAIVSACRKTSFYQQQQQQQQHLPPHHHHHSHHHHHHGLTSAKSTNCGGGGGGSGTTASSPTGNSTGTATSTLMLMMPSAGSGSGQLQQPSSATTSSAAAAAAAAAAANVTPQPLSRHGGTQRVTHNMSHSSSNVLRARRGVVRMLIIFVLTFALCNLPYHARKMWQYWSRSYRGDSNFNALLTPLTFLVTYFNSGINPLLYAFLSRNFRKGMKELLLCSWKKGKGKSSSNSSMHHKRMALQTHSLPTDTTHIGNEQL